MQFGGEGIDEVLIDDVIAREGPAGLSVLKNIPPAPDARQNFGHVHKFRLAKFVLFVTFKGLKYEKGIHAHIFIYYN